MPRNVDGEWGGDLSGCAGECHMVAAWQLKSSPLFLAGIEIEAACDCEARRAARPPRPWSGLGLAFTRKAATIAAWVLRGPLSKGRK
ncbi:MAG: hypothetical protein WDM86_18875 [Rhizomicrobium sp.]